MKISESITNLVLDIKKFSAAKLKNEQDISILLEASLYGDNKKLFDEMIFTAKYLNGLGKILHSNMTNAAPQSVTTEDKMDENAEEKIRNEFKQNMIKFTSQISKLINDFPSEDKNSVEDKYLAMNRTSLVNLTSLIYDLSWVKKYFNSRK